MNVTLNQIGEALWCSKGDFFWDLNFFFFFYFRIARTLLQSHYSHLHNFTLFWLILSKHAGCSALIHLVALQKKIHTKQQQERGLGGEAATFFFL